MFQSEVVSQNTFCVRELSFVNRAINEICGKIV